MSERKESPTEETREGMVIKLTDIDRHFKYEISRVPGAERIMLCFQCGTCTADCPVARFSDSYRPRKIMRMTQLGLKKRVLSSDLIWLCAACFTCVDHCPQEVEIASVLRTLRNLAVKEGFMPTVFKELTSNLLQTGLAYKIPESRLRRRRETGLPPLPESNLESVNKLADVTGFLKLIQARRD